MISVKGAFHGLLEAMLVASFLFGAVSAQETAPKEDIYLTADGGIDWLREEKKHIARHNAMVERGALTLRADKIESYYETTAGKNSITRVDAIGRVIAKDGETIAKGDKAVYHLESDIIVMIGRDLEMINQQGIITARDSLEYWNLRKIAVARGDATIRQEDKLLRAGALTAFIDENKQPNPEQEAAGTTTQISRIDATGGVHLSTLEEILTGNEGVYNVDKQIFRICGDVKITRAGSQLKGECANVDMRTGKSRIEAGKGKIQGLIIPN